MDCWSHIEQDVDRMEVVDRVKAQEARLGRTMPTNREIIDAIEAIASSPANETAYGGRLQATCSRSDNGRQRVIDARLRMASGREFAVAYTARVHGMFRQRIEARMTMTFGDAGQPFTPLEQPEADTWSGNGLNDRKRWSDEAMRALCAVVDTASLISHGVAAEVLSRQIDHLIACTDAIGAPELEPAQEPNEPEAEAPAP